MLHQTCYACSNGKRTDRTIKFMKKYDVNKIKTLAIKAYTLSSFKSAYCEEGGKTGEVLEICDSFRNKYSHKIS